MTRIRTAIPGTGFMAWVHADALSRIGADVVGILGSSPEKSESAARRSGIGKAYAAIDELWIGHRDRANEILIRDPALLSPEAKRHAAYPGGHNEGYADSFRACFAAFYDAIRRRDFSTPSYPTFADGHREIQVCEAILKSHKTRSWVDV